jgi:hypothetical protein
VGFKGKGIESKEKSHQGPMISSSSSSSSSLSAIPKAKRKRQIFNEDSAQKIKWALGFYG